jgi:hypothetical protein
MLAALCAAAELVYRSPVEPRLAPDQTPPAPLGPGFGLRQVASRE